MRRLVMASYPHSIVYRETGTTVGCGPGCAQVCPRGVLKLEKKRTRWKAGQPIRVYAVDL